VEFERTIISGFKDHAIANYVTALKELAEQWSDRN
jgi:hypothetical protein